MLERFLPEDASTVSELRSVFADLYSLSDDANALQELIERVRINPERFVMKPQREGGGNNFYGKEILGLLEGLEKSQLAAFILMERIQPPQQLAECLRDGVAIQVG